MPRLMLLRHAKSSWGDAALADRDRPLSKRGRKSAELMAGEIVARGLLPDRILCSPAKRTRETLDRLVPLLPGPVPVDIVEALYDGGDLYRDAVLASRGKARTVLVVGHNPATHATALGLVGSTEGEAGARLRAKYPTGALTVIDFDEEAWRDLSPGGGRLAAFVRPRDLDAEAGDD